MKKYILTILAVIGAFLAEIGIACLAIIIVLALSFSIGLPLLILIAASAAFGLDALRRVFKRKFGFSSVKFMIYAHLPSIVFLISYWIYDMAMESADHFTGFMAGLGEFLFAFSHSITVVTILMMQIIIAMIFTAVEKRRNVSLNEE